MKRLSLACSSAALLFLLLFPGAVQQTHAQPMQANGFNVTNAQWGTPGNALEAGPGQQNVPLTISLQYLFINTATNVAGTLSLPQGFTDTTSGSSVSTAYSSQNLPSGSVVPLTFYLNTAPSVPVGSYMFTLTITWGVNIAANPYAPPVSQSMVQSAQVVVAIKGRVQLQFSTSQASLTPGTVNHVPITVSNIGTGDATNVLLSITASSSLLAQSGVSVLNSPPQISTIRANSSTTTHVDVFVPQSLAASNAILSIVGSYYDAYGSTRTISTSVGVYVASLSAAPLTVTLDSSTALTPGSVNNATVVISNIGAQALHQLQMSVTVPASVSLLRQFPISLANLNSGGSVQVSIPIFVSAALSGSPITIPVTVTYADVAGGTGSTTQNVGFYVPISNLATNPRIGLSGYSYSPALVFPGTAVATLQVVISNSGTTAASNLNVTLIPADPVYAVTKGSFTQTAGALPAGQSFPFTFTLGILNSSIPVNGTLRLSVGALGVSPREFTIPFVEQPKANFKVVSVSSPPIASGDGADQIVITLRNTGRAAAQLTLFTMQPSYVFEPSTQGSFTTSQVAGAGTIAPGASTNLTVVIQVNSNLQPGSYPLIFHATWTQLGSTQPFSQDITLTVPVTPSAFQVVNGVVFSLPFLAAVVILIGALVALRRARRRTRPTEAQPKP